MNLFNKIPDNFFSILSSKNKNIYGLALVTLYDALTMYHNRIRKSDYLDLLKSRGEKEVNLLVYEDEDEDKTPFIEPSFNSKANEILRRLVNTGWVLLEPDFKTGAEYILLPSYSISMMKLLYEFIDGEESKYVSFVHTTYSDLKLQDELQDEYMYKTLESAVNSTKELEIEVAKLDHSIRVFHRQLSSIFSPNEVLKQHFDICREDVVDPIYHPLKTNDSIILYNGPINFILSRWLKTPSVLNKIIEQCLRDNTQIHNELDAKQDIIKKINYIQDTYNRLVREIEDIDKSQSSYTKASAEKVIYLNNSDKSIKGKLETIFLDVAKAISGDNHSLKTIKAMNNSISLFQQGYIEYESLTKPYKHNSRFDSDPIPLDDDDHEANETLMQSLLDIVDQYSDEKVMEFMKNAFKDQNSINVKDIPLKDVEDFIMLILGTVKSNSNSSFYQIKRPEKVKNVDIDKFSVPNLNYEKKGN